MSSATPIGAAIAAGGMLAAIVADALPDAPPSVWTVALAVLSAWTLFRAGSVRAWKETAEAREQRIRDLSYELGDVRTELANITAELAIPERIESLVELLSSSATRTEILARERQDLAFERLDQRWSEFNAAAQARSDALLDRLDKLEETIRTDHAALLERDK